MIVYVYAFCDFCRKDCGNNAYMISITTFGNFINNHNSKDIYGRKDKSKSFVICQDCYKNPINLPNPYEEYSQTCNMDNIKLNKTVNQYKDEDFFKR